MPEDKCRRAIVHDPVCHMEVERGGAAVERRHGGAMFSFCSLECAELFDRHPGRYVWSRPAGEGRTHFDFIVIGGGPAGLTAGVYAAVHRLQTLLIADRVGGPAVERVEVRNCAGFQFIEGRDVAARFREQLLHSGFIQHRLDRATALRSAPEGFRVQTARGAEYTAEAVLFATGVQQGTLGVPGEERLCHRGVAFNAVQDAELLHGCDVAIVGGGNPGLQAVQRLTPVARRLFLLSVGPLKGNASDVAAVRGIANVTILEHTVVQEVLGEERVEGIRVARTAGGDERVIDVAALLVEIGFAPNSGLLVGLAELNERGEVVIGPDGSTSTPGLFAAGDVTAGYAKRVIIACGEGAKAALAAYDYLASRRQRPERRQ